MHTQHNNNSGPPPPPMVPLIKTHTSSGNVICRYTMGVVYKPQFKKKKYANQEKKSQFDFVFRADWVKKDYAFNSNKFFETEKEALFEKFADIRHRCEEVQFFDNSKPFKESRVAWYVNDKLIERFGKRIE